MTHPIVITDYGARGDGHSLCHQAINQAIEEVSRRGGGRVVVPAGLYRIGTVVLRSGVELHLETGAVLLASTDLRDYVPRVWGHHDDITPWHLILAEDQTRIALTGYGTIRGSGPAFWEANRPSLSDFFKARKRTRPSPMVELVRCRDVRVEGLRLEDSPGWTLHGHDCDDLRIRELMIRNTPYGPNVDGIDLTGCHDVRIEGCNIRTADDAIALKTSEYSRSCERVIIANCHLSTSCVAVRVGYESRQDFRDILIHDLIVPRCSRIFDFRALEGATIERIRAERVTARVDAGWPAARPIEVVCQDIPHVFRDLLPPEHPDYRKDKPLTRSGKIRDIVIRGLDVVADGRIHLVGQPHSPLEDVRISEVRMRYVVLDDFSAFAGVKNPSYLPGSDEATRGANACLVVRHARKIRVEDFQVTWPDYPVRENWELFQSAHTALSPFWKDQVEAVRSGQKRVAWSWLWARDAEMTLRNCCPSASEPNHPALDVDVGTEITPEA